jgi:hypothetical protein
MNADPLEKLLREADADAGPLAPLPADLGRRVRVQAARRRWQRLGVRSAAAAAILLAIGVSIPLLTRTPVAPDTGMNVAETRADVRMLQARADAHAAVAARMVALQQDETKRAAHEARLAAYEQQAAGPDPVATARAAAEQAAATLVRSAYRLQRESNLPAPALETYRQVIRLFPETTWARVARVHLEQMTRPEGETS